MQNGRTSLICAAAQGHANIMLELMKHGANVNAQSKVGLKYVSDVYVETCIVYYQV